MVSGLRSQPQEVGARVRSPEKLEVLLFMEGINSFLALFLWFLHALVSPLVGYAFD